MTELDIRVEQLDQRRCTRGVLVFHVIGFPPSAASGPVASVQAILVLARPALVHVGQCEADLAIQTPRRLAQRGAACSVGVLSESRWLAKNWPGS